MGEWVTRDQAVIMQSVVDHRYTAVPSCHDVGKGLALDTPLPTPSGWTTIGEIQPGDWLLGEDGRPVKVSWVSPERNTDCYEIVFGDKSRLTCDKDHLWTTIDAQACYPRVDDWRTAWDRGVARTVVQVRDTLLFGKHQQRNHIVPNARALDLPEADLPIDPYVLGAWLGDGTTSEASFTCFDSPILEEIQRRGWEVRPWTAEGHFGISPSRLGGVPALRAAGVLNNKHIPPVYLRASYQQRLDLLRGLMDTDGYHAGGAVGEISLSHQRLAADVAELIRSLGWCVRLSSGVATLNGEPKSVYYRMIFTADVVPFHLPRKVALWSRPKSQRTTGRTIASIEPVESVPTRCLAVESESRLFLAGRDMIPTHNSWTASRITAWWLDSHPVGEAFVVTTAPTAAQVSAILWREIGRAHRKAELWGYITGDNQWKIGHKAGASEPVAYGRKPANYDATGFQGVHARYVLVILDEACGIPRSLYDAVDSLATNENARVLAIGNPDDPSSYFHTVCKPGSGWNVIQIDALRSPRFTLTEVRQHPELMRYMIEQGVAPTDEVIPEDLKDLLVSPTWVAERIKRWGVQSPIFQSKVRGRFPDVTTDTLINPHWITLAAARETVPTPTMAKMGADVARYGTDHSTLMLRQGGHCRVIEDIAYGPTTEFAGVIIKRGNEHMAHPAVFPVVCVDDVGVGGGVTDMLREQGVPVVAIVGGAASTQRMANGKPRFVNKRSELWWNMREAFAGRSGTGDDGWLDIDPFDDDLQAQLSNIKYKINSHGQIVVESKDEMKQRGLSSPDRGDALAYALAPDMPEEQSYAQHRTELMVNADILGMQW